ncbi:hypothetical protein [Sulfitobacter sp.]|uniref:hypothetical protein n=1 Tax=Sulfitobacter sp. TaxID=1903071 RepID=UPI0035654200
MSSARTPKVGLLALFVFLLFSMPRLNIKLGPVPVYAMDVVAALILYQMALSARTAKRLAVPFRNVLIIICFFIILSEFSVLVYGGSLLDAIYISIRYFLTFGIMFAVPNLIRGRADIEIVLKGLALALLISSLLMLLSSLPQTRGIAVFLFSIPFLEPTSAADRLLRGAADSGVRGRTLIGVSILSGAFISIAWPLVAYLRTQRFRLSALWSIVSVSAVTLSPLAIVVSYSRQAAVGGILVLLAALILPLSDLRRSLLRPFLLSVGVVLVVGVGSSLFFFDRYVNRFTAVVENPLDDVNESARFLSYVVPFEHVVDHPQFLFVGAGATAERSSKITIDSFKENHSLLGAGYFAHGMLSTLLLFFLIFASFRFANWHRIQAQNLAFIARGWPRSLFLAYLPILPMAAFAPALGTNLRAMYVFMLLLGLLATLRNTDLIASLETDEEPETPGPEMDNVENTAQPLHPPALPRKA